MDWALCLLSLSRYSHRLRVSNWAATFDLLEVEAGKVTYKELIHMDLVFGSEFIKTCVYEYVQNYKLIHWRENCIQSIGEIILAIL